MRQGYKIIALVNGDCRGKESIYLGEKGVTIYNEMFTGDVYNKMFTR